MKGDPKVIEYLNRGLRSELTAINQYWLHYRMLDNWGLKDLAKKWREESIEEMKHADKFVERIIFLDGFPNLQVLDPLRIGQNVKEMLDCDLAAEQRRARALSGSRDLLPFGQGLSEPRSVRGADEGRGRPYRLPRNAARSRRQARRRTLLAASYRRARTTTALIRRFDAGFQSAARRRTPRQPFVNRLNDAPRCSSDRRMILRVRN